MSALPLYFQRLRRMLLRRGRSHAESEDLIQDAFVRMQEYCESGKQVRHPESFMARTVLRLASNARRDEHRELYCDLDTEELALLVSTAPTPEQVLAAEECLRRMSEALQNISPRTRDIFFMQRLDGRTYAEIARRMGISVSAVEKHMASALVAMAEWNQAE